MKRYRELMNSAKKILEQNKIADADVDAWYLLAYVTGFDRVSYLMHAEEFAPEPVQLKYMDYIHKRATHVPLQHITGTQEFMGLEFHVTEDVLIPRQDTECLVEEVLKVCNNKSVLDMCTGSGCIIISLAKLGNLTKAVGVDISDPALNIAKKNALTHGVDVTWLQSDLFEKVEGSFDIIVSNPPYIPTQMIEQLMPEVQYHEPRTALDGSEDGLIFYRKITWAMLNHLNKGGYIFYEIGHDQGKQVREILSGAGLCDIRVIKDLSGNDRIVVGKRPI